MNKTTRILASLALSASIAFNLTSPAFALRSAGDVPSVSKLQTKGQAQAPLGFLIFCLKNAQHCRGGGASEIKLTGDIYNALKSVNSQVNRQIRPKRDKGDIWAVNVRSGDCEDYVLTKRARLVQMGLPASALRIAAARTRWGEGHAVLVVRTNEGDLVLDNLNNSVKQWNETGHTWIAMSGSNPQRWNKV